MYISSCIFPHLTCLIRKYVNISNRSKSLIFQSPISHPRASHSSPNFARMLIPLFLRIKPSSSSSNLLLKDNTLLVNGCLLTFSQVFHKNPNESVEIVQPYVQTILEGSDATIFTMGPSGSGKSHAMQGLITTALDSLFSIIDNFNDHTTDAELEKCVASVASVTQRPSRYGNKVIRPSHVHTSQSPKKYIVTILAFELYLDGIYDLLDDSKLLRELCTDPVDGRVRPRDLSSTCVTRDNAVHVISDALAKRHVTETKMNGVLLRGHVFVYIYVHEVGSSVQSARLTLADLAGTERIRGCARDTQREGNSTNNDITALGRALSSLQNGGAPRAVVRALRVTRLLLSGVLDYGERMAVLVCVDLAGDERIIALVLRSLGGIGGLEKQSGKKIPGLTGPSAPASTLKHLGQSYSLAEENRKLQEILTIKEQEMVLLEVQIRQEMASEYNQIIERIEQSNRELMSQIQQQNERVGNDKIEMVMAENEAENSRLKQKLRLLENNYKEQVFRRELEQKVMKDLERQVNIYNDNNIRLQYENEKLKSEMKRSSETKGYRIELDRDRERYSKENEELRQENERLRREVQGLRKEVGRSFKGGVLRESLYVNVGGKALSPGRVKRG